MRQVTCESCGRVVSLQPGETRACPSCGNLLAAPQAGAAEEQTQRLGPPPAAQDDGTTRPIDPSALPPPPAQSQPRSGDVPAAASGGTPLWPGDATTQALPAELAPPPAPAASQPTAVPVARTRSRAPLMLSVLALVLLLALVAVGGVLASAHLFPFANASATPTVAPTQPPTATPPPGYLLYRDVQGIYTIYYPAGWTAKQQDTQGGTGVALVKPDSTAGMALLQVAVPGTPTNQQLLENQFQQLARQGTVSNQQQLADGTVGGTSWAQGSVDWLPSQQGAVAEHVVVLATVHNGRAFVIELLETQGNSAGADEATLETMLASFTFLS